MNDLPALRALGSDQRNNARAKAARNLALKELKEPTLETTKTQTKFPVAVNNTINIFVITVTVMCFVPSAFRIFSATNFVAHQSKLWDILVYVVAFCSIFVAELGQIVCTLALVKFDKKGAKALLWGSTIACTIYALAGNFVASNITASFMDDPFSYLEALLPTIIVIVMSYILKQQFLDDIEHQHKVTQEYQKNLLEYREAVASIEKHPKWLGYYRQALKEEIFSFNSRFKINGEWAKDLMLKIPELQWFELVEREIARDEMWFKSATIQEPAPVEVPALSEPTPEPVQEPVQAGSSNLKN